MSDFAIPAFRLGNLTLTPLVLGEIEDTPRSWFSDAPAEVPADQVRMPVNCLHICGPDCSVLIDACDPSAYPISNRSNAGVRATFEEAGISPDTISHVILTHGHHDHFCGVWDYKSDRPSFPHARHIVSAQDWAGDTLTDAAQFADGSAADPRPLENLHRLGLLNLQGSDNTIPPEISLLDAAGETDGHRVVRIASKSEIFFFLGDLYHLLAEMRTPALCPTWTNTEALLGSRVHIAGNIQQADATFMCSHIAGLLSADDLHSVNTDRRIANETRHSI